MLLSFFMLELYINLVLVYSEEFDFFMLGKNGLLIWSNV